MAGLAHLFVALSLPWTGLPGHLCLGSGPKESPCSLPCGGGAGSLLPHPLPEQSPSPHAVDLRIRPVCTEPSFISLKRHCSFRMPE